MPKPENKYDRRHLQFIQELLWQIDEIYKSATREAAAIGVSIGGFDSERPLDFKDYPLTARRVDRLVKQLGKALEVCMVNGVESEWTLANNKNNELAKRVFGKNVGRLTQAQYRRYFSNNDAAREAFVKRKENGLTLSDRVWKYTDEFKDEIEMGIDLGLRGGLSADQMARDLQQYLQHPDMLFRRVRDEHGILHLSKRAKDYHPGRGVYRSSYKNARRLAATECNTAYRTADHERWQKMDFVVGQEIHLSGNHTCKGKDGKPHKFEDMCDKLQGRYPKDFKFTGWHPHCRCYATSILKTDEEIAEDTRKMLAGEAVDGESVNEVKDVPEGFKEWMRENEGRIARAKSVPVWMRENEGLISKAEVNFLLKEGGIKTTEDLTSGNMVPAPDKVGRFVDISHDDMMKRLQELSQNFTHEEAYVELSDGRVYHKIGGRGEVVFNGDERRLFKGGALFHNHINEPLSPEDISFVINNDMRLIVAVSRLGKYEARVTSETIRMSKEEIIKLHKECGDQIEKQMKNMNSKEYTDCLLNFQHLNMEALCAVLKVNYCKIFK